MKEITLLSGKGGTGKTTITAALASMANDLVFCDNDVDGSDLHLILQPEIKEEHIFEGAWLVSIDQKICINCDTCTNNCRFDAIHKKGGKLTVNPYQCEGCRLCERSCPVHAIYSKRSVKNKWFVSDTRFGTMVHARMAPGEENSGKLVSIIRNKSKEIAKKQNFNYIINDGPPGIGCTAISSITGSDLVLLIIEPTKSGLHDALRVVELNRSFKIPISAVINKFDLNKKMSSEIEHILSQKGIRVLTKIPFDLRFIHAMIESKTVCEYDPESPTAQKIASIWMQIKQSL